MRTDTLPRMTTQKTSSHRGSVLAAVLFFAGVPAIQASGTADWPRIAPVVQAPVFPDRQVKLGDFGGVGDGRTLNTVPFEKAIAALADKGGGRLVVSPGLWLTGPIRLRSNIHLFLEAGALIQFSGDHTHYPLVVLDVKGEKEVASISPISGENLENVAITGEGILDGGGNAWRPVKKGKLTEDQWKSLVKSGGVLTAKGDMWWPDKQAMDGSQIVDKMQDQGILKIGDYAPFHHYLRPKMFKLINCRKVWLEGVTFQNAPNWTLNPTLCTDLLIQNVTVRNPWFAQNSDGLDIESCRNAIVRDCKFDVGDDAICLKSGKDAVGRRIGAPTENLLVENCVVYHGHGGVVIGSEMSGGVRNVRVDNCVFIGTDVGLRFKSTRGRGGVVDKIYLSNIRMVDIPGEAISFNLYYGGKSPLDEDKGGAASETVPKADETTPQFREIHMDGVVCSRAQTAMMFRGLPEMPIRNLFLSGVSITADKGASLTDVDGVRFENVRLQVKSGPAVTPVRVGNSKLDIMP